MKIEESQEHGHVALLGLCISIMYKLNGFDFEVTKIWCVFGAVVHNCYFGLCYNKAEAAAVLLYIHVEVRKTLEVLYFLMVAFKSHTRVPFVG